MAASSSNTAFPQKNLIIGSGPDADIQVRESSVERQHAEIYQQSSGRWMISDLGTASGTLVNDRRISLAALREGDVVTIGSKSLVWPKDFIQEQAPSASSPTPQVQEVQQAPQAQWLDYGDRKSVV